MEAKKIKISEIKLNPNNPRLIKDDKFAKLVKSVKEFPEMLDIRPIVVNSDMIILGGNMRFRACKEAGLKEIPVIIAEGLTEQQQKEFLIKDNVAGGEWDWDMLANEWEVEQLDAWGLDIPNFDVTELEAVEDDFEVPEDGVETDIVLGDLFEIGEHRLLCGDSTDSDQVAKLMNGQKADMVFTDPPYGIKVVGKNGKVGGDNLAKNGVYAEIIGDDTTETAKEFYDTCISLGMENFIIWGGNYFTDFLNPNRCWVVWFKNHVTERTFANCELAWTNIDHNSKTYSSTWDGYTKEGESGSKIHPSQKPIKLCSDVLQDFTEKNDIVYDGFLGSGSTLIVCEKLQRQCLGIELDPKYCDVIVKRWQDFTGKEATLESTGETFGVINGSR